MHRAWMVVTSPFVTRLHPNNNNNHHHNTHGTDSKTVGSGLGSRIGLRYEEEETVASTSDHASGSGNGSGNGSGSSRGSPEYRLRPLLRPETDSETESQSGVGVDGSLSPQSPSFRESLRYFQQKIDTISNRQTLSTASPSSNVKPWEQVRETSIDI